MRILFSLSAAEMSRACDRLHAALAEEATDDVERIAFTIAARHVEIATKETAEGIAAEVQRPGRASVPCTVMHGVISTLPYFGCKKIQVGFSAGKMLVDSMVFHHPKIVLTDSAASQRRQSLCGSHGER